VIIFHKKPQFPSRSDVYVPEQISMPCSNEIGTWSPNKTTNEWEFEKSKEREKEQHEHREKEQNEQRENEHVPMRMFLWMK